jgi:hypothetical protein
MPIVVPSPLGSSSAVTITWSDLQVFQANIAEDLATALITGAIARAALIAPCILDEDFPYADAAKAIIMDTILRRAESGAGSLAMEQAGPFQRAIDTRTSPRELYTPGEIADLQRLCQEAALTGGTGMPTGNFPTTEAWPDPLWQATSYVYPTGNL